nr:putative inactive serine/threonine-protein kinase scy1 [Quercus suber]
MVTLLLFGSFLLKRILTLLLDYQRLSHRLNTSKLIENSEYFQNKLDTFFRKLPNLAEQLPRPIVLKKLVPLLASALEFGSAAAPALAALLKMGSWLSTEEFSSKVMLFQYLYNILIFRC